jgi:hypothetical protein
VRGWAEWLIELPIEGPIEYVLHAYGTVLLSTY